VRTRDAHAGHADGAHAQHGDTHDANAHGAAPGGRDGGTHDRHAGHSVAMFRNKFWVSLALTVPILVWGHMLPALFGYPRLPLPGAHWIIPLLGTAVFAYGGWPFVQGAARELKDRLPGMMTLIALAIGVAFLFSVVVTLGFPGMPLWEELATLVTIMLLGHWLEMRSINQAQGALGELARLLPDHALRVSGEGAAERVDEVAVAELREGDTVLVRPGARIPVDGVVRAGESSVGDSE
jgi:Cu2+-exporting ATPase